MCSKLEEQIQRLHSVERQLGVRFQELRRHGDDLSLEREVERDLARTERELLRLEQLLYARG
ncbi:MAG: hypothetical protein AMXMBFR33_40320 [Candidatus Xenobia bacterium]